MNNIILLIGLNILVYYLYKKNIYLLISLFIFMIYYTLKIRSNIKKNIIEGNSKECNLPKNDKKTYKDNFVKSLDKQIVNNRKKDNLYDSILDKLNIFLKIYKDTEDIPKDRPCIGIFDSWSECSADCGVGSKYRTFHVLQEAGENGFKCIYGDGDIEKITCREGLCNYGDYCDNDDDCNTKYCNKFINKCGYENECTKYQLYNCDFDECDKLGKNYHYNRNGNCIDYSQRENKYDPKDHISKK